MAPANTREDGISATGRRLVGYAIVVDQPSVDLGGFVEYVDAAALVRTKRDRPDLRALFDHDPARLLGRASAHTVEYEVDARGLKVTIDPPATSTGDEVVELVRRGDLREMSFAFSTLLDDWRMQGERLIRRVLDMTIRECSIVSWAAYPSTSIGLRGDTPVQDVDDTVERWNGARTAAQRQHYQKMAELLRAINAGKIGCARCEAAKRSHAPAVAVRNAEPLCQRCVSRGDEIRRHLFGLPAGGRSIAEAQRQLRQLT